jgi:hypothetical protein
MSFDGAGTYSLVAGLEANLANGQPNDGTEVYAAFADVATALTTAICKDGQTTITANLPMAGYRHTGVGNPTARTQYATVAGVQDGTYAYLTSVSGTNTIAATAALSMTAYATGQAFLFTPANANTGATTININSIGAKNIYHSGAALAGGELQQNVPALIMYDGTQFNLVASGNAALAGIVTTKGDMLVATASARMSRLAVGTNDHILVADSAQTTGVKWASAASVVGAASDSAAGIIEIAIKSEMETGTSTTLAVTAGRAQHHPSALKVWAIFGVAGDRLSDYNISSISDTGAGRATVVFDTDFVNGNYCVTTGLVLSSGTNFSAYQREGTNNVGSVEINCINSATGSLTDPTHYYCVHITGVQ